MSCYGEFKKGSLKLIKNCFENVVHVNFHPTLPSLPSSLVYNAPSSLLNRLLVLESLQNKHGLKTLLLFVQTLSIILLKYVIIRWHPRLRLGCHFPPRVYKTQHLFCYTLATLLFLFSKFCCHLQT